jgi:glutamate decarboxylase
MSINFSRSASQIVAQYYNFLRFGYNGFLKIHQHTQKIASYIEHELAGIGLFDIINGDYNSIPVVCFKLKEINSWNLYDLSNYLERSGWKIPVYHLPSSLEDIAVSRIVCRSDLSLNLAEHLMEDILFAIQVLTESSFSYPNKRDAKGFRH